MPIDERVLAAVNAINKKHKTDIIQFGNVLKPIERIPFGSPKMNWLTRGGMPRGRMVEFAGKEGSGKTTTAFDLIAQAQKMGLNCFFVDAENTFDEDWATNNGVDVESLTLIKPKKNESAEELLEMVLDLVDTGLYGCGVIDSIPYLIPKAVLAGTMEDASYCGNAGAMTKFVGKVGNKLARNECLLVMINQLRDAIGASYVAYNTPGGRALKHAYSFRLFFNKGRFVDADCKELTNSCENPAGNIVEVKVEKNKVCKPDRRLGGYTIKYECGVDIYNDTLEVAVETGVIRQGGSWYMMVNEDGEVIKDDEGKELKFNGKKALFERLGNDDILFSQIYEETCKRAVA